MEYCARHGLKTKTFVRWMKHFVGVEEARRHTEELRELRRKERRQQTWNSHRFAGFETDAGCIPNYGP
jgi:hypothetical protein